jgi:site-specific DNA-methyltransferase (adenine-specific)
MKMPNVRLICADAVEGVRKLEDGSVNCIITDPAYESLEKYRAIGTTTRLKESEKSSNEWFAIFPNERFDEFFVECYRVLAKGSHLYMFCDDETSDIAKASMTSAGFHVWKRIVWDKMVMGMGYHYRAQYEFILFAEKGKRNLIDRGISDVMRCKRISNGYPTEKPVPLQKTLVLQSTEEGEVVLDPFCGSGSSGAAAVKLKRGYIGIDNSEKALGIAVKRIEAAGAIRR